MTTTPARMDLADLLGQDEVWQTRDRRLVPLEDLTRDQRAIVLRWLGARAEALQLAEEIEFLVMPMPDIDTVAHDMLMVGDPLPPGEWLEEHPLVQRLRELDDLEDP